MSDLSAELEGLREELEASNPTLYRHLALYLQVLRQILRDQVEQACFHLATQVHPRRYTSVTEAQRGHFHQRLRSLVNRCCSLLTVEQLTTLAAQIDREQRRQGRRQGQELLERLTEQAELPAGHHNGAALRPGSPSQDGANPLGSVELGLSLPLSSDWFGLEASHHPEAGSAGQEGSDGPSEREPPGESTPDEESSLAMAQAMVQAFQDVVGGLEEVLPPGGEPTATSSDGDAENRQEAKPGADAAQASATPPDDGEEGDASPWASGRLPREPDGLLIWLDGLEQALARRLRNLSHAINVELLRVGLNRSLLPVHLLDAILSGQLETMATPVNLVRLQLPFGPSQDADPLEAMAVLLRGGDLEMEEPRLRTCRRRIEEHRQDVRKMARQFRRLQRRLHAHQAQQLWLQDIRTTHPGDD